MSTQNGRDEQARNYSPDLVGAKSDKGPVRQANEDAFWVPDAETPTELGALYVVTDGVGGQEDGAAAAQLAALMVRDTFYRLREGGEEIQAALQDAIHQANQAVYEEAQTRSGGRMGCTIVAAVQDQGQLVVAHVGDARAYLVRSDKLHQLTRDDTWVQKQVEAGLITPEDAVQHELRNVVTQVLGNKPEIHVHLAAPRTLRNGDILLLCSDGLYDALSENEMLQLLTGGQPPTAAAALVQAATVAGAGDNITAVVVNSGSNGAAPTPVPSRRARRRLPLWLSLLLLAALGLVLLGGLALLWLWLPNLTQVRSPASTPTTASLAGAGLESTTPAAVASPLPTFTPAAVNVAAAQVTSTLRPTDTATPPPSPTATATPLPSPTPRVYACVGDLVLYVWQDEQIEAGACGQFAGEGFVLTLGDEVQVLDLNAISASGPDAACRDNTFMRVQSVADPDVEGWVIADSIQLLPAGERCNP